MSEPETVHVTLQWWELHAQEHERVLERLEALREGAEAQQSLIARQTEMLGRVEERLKMGSDEMARSRQERAELAEAIRALQPRPKSWSQMAFAGGGVVLVLCGWLWSASEIWAREKEVAALKREVSDHGSQLATVTAQSRELAAAAAANRAAIQAIRDYVAEIKADVRALRR